MLTHVVLCVNIRIEQTKKQQKTTKKKKQGGIRNGNERVRNQKIDV